MSESSILLFWYSAHVSAYRSVALISVEMRKRMTKEKPLLIL